TVVLVWWLMTEWSLLGAAYGMLLGNAAASAGLWAAFLAIVPRSCDPAPATRVLEVLTRSSDPARWSITRLGEGDHSTVYAVKSTDSQPILGTYQDLVLKLYKPEAALTLGMVEEQFASLA